MEMHAQQLLQLQQQQALRVIRRRILDIDLTIAKTLNDVAERREIGDELTANDVHAIVNTFDNVVADYFSPERWRPLRDVMGTAAWPRAEWQLAVQRLDHAASGIAERRRVIRRSDLLFEKIVLDELGLRCHLIQRALGGDPGGAKELLDEIRYYRQVQLTDRSCPAGQALATHLDAHRGRFHDQQQQQQQLQQLARSSCNGAPAFSTNAAAPTTATAAAAAAAAAAADAGVRFNARVNVKEFKTHQ